MPEVPALEIYDQHGNYLPVVKVEAKTGNTLIVTVETVDLLEVMAGRHSS